MKYIDDIAAETDKIIADYLKYYEDKEDKEVGEILALKIKDTLVSRDEEDLVVFLLTVLLGEGVSTYVEREANIRSQKLS